MRSSPLAHRICMRPAAFIAVLVTAAGVLRACRVRSQRDVRFAKLAHAWKDAKIMLPSSVCGVLSMSKHPQALMSAAGKW